MADGREILRSAGAGTVKALAGLFALSWMGTVLFPMTLGGLVALILALLWLIHLYRRNSPIVKTLVALVVSGLAIFAANILVISRFDGPAYIFSCPSLSAACVSVRRTEAYGRSVLIVPVWKPKTALFRFVLGSRDGLYFPRSLRSDGTTIIHAPLEEQAVQEMEPADSKDRPGFHVHVNLPVANFGIEKADEADKYELTFGVLSSLIEGLDFDSALSNSVPGQFSIMAASEPGIDEWRRLAFANETIRALMVDPANFVIAELRNEASRTGRMDDYVRYETIKIGLNRGFYADIAGASQRLYELRSAIRRADTDGEFRVAANLPWNRAFILAAMQTIDDLSEYYVKTQPRLQRRAADGSVVSTRTVSVPWQADRAWIEEKGHAVLAEAKTHDPYAKAVVANFLDSAPEGLGEAYRSIEEMSPLDREGLRAQSIIDKGRLFEAFLVQWLDEEPKARIRRVATMADQLTAAYARDAVIGMNEIFTQVGGGSDELSPDQRRLILGKLRATRAAMAANLAKVGILKSYAATEFQRISLSQDLTGQNPFFDLLERLVTCGSSEKDCGALAVDYYWSFVGKTGQSSLLFNLFMRLGFDDSGGARYPSERLADLYGSVAPAATVQEFDQAVGPVLIAVALRDWPEMQRFLPRLCAAADGYSRALLSEVDSESRVMLHEGAILLAELCQRPWGRRHRLMLAQAGLEPGPWVAILQRKIIKELRSLPRPRASA